MEEQSLKLHLSCLYILPKAKGYIIGVFRQSSRPSVCSSVTILSGLYIKTISDINMTPNGCNDINETYHAQ